MSTHLNRAHEVSDAAIEKMPDANKETSAHGSVLRVVLLLLTLGQMVFVVALTVFIIRHMNPLGDGMEFVAVSAAIMLLEVPFTIPAFVLAVRGKALGVAACLAGFATFAYVIFWVQVYAEVAAKSAS
jgi:cation transport ATPase